jgi:DNA-binding MarR family transcriptional regulator
VVSSFGHRLAERPGVLRLIGASAGQSQRALGQRLGILPSRLVALVDELEGRGLVERRDDPGDRRSYALHLTEAGHEILRDIGRIAREHGNSVCAALSEEERQLSRRSSPGSQASRGSCPAYTQGSRASDLDAASRALFARPSSAVTHRRAPGCSASERPASASSSNVRRGARRSGR